MPRLTDLTEMTDKKVYAWLSTLPISMYFGVQEEMIRDILKHGEARRYLTDLILKNDWKKADFEMISDQGSFEESARQHQGSQEQEEESKIVTSITNS